MQPHTLALIACLAPLPAAAFGDLDCISVETCVDGQCSATTDAFAVTFDWAGSAAIVDIGDTTVTYPLVAGDEGSGDLPDTDLEFGDIAGGNPGLLVIAESPDDILAFFAEGPAPITLRTGFCDVREAA